MKYLGNFVALLILAVNALFTGLLLFTAYSPHIQPVTHPVQSCLGLTFPVFLMINIGFFIFWLVIQRYKTALLPLIGLLLCYSQTRTYLPINFHTNKLPETSFKLLSYNIMGFDGAIKQNGKNPILTYLKESNADILCLQEYSTTESSRHLSQKDVEQELKAYPYHRINTVGREKGHTNKIACYSKYPILSARVLDYSSEYNGSVLYEVKIGEDTVTLINNHLESNKLTKADKAVYENMLKSPEKEKVKSGMRLLIRKLAEASAIRAPQADTIRTRNNSFTTSLYHCMWRFQRHPHLLYSSYHRPKSGRCIHQIRTGIRNFLQSEQILFSDRQYIDQQEPESLQLYSRPFHQGFRPLSDMVLYHQKELRIEN